MMPKVAAGASMLMGAAATLKYKVVDEWAPKAMDILTDPAHVGDRAEEAKLRAEEAKRKLRRSVSADNLNEWKEKAKVMTTLLMTFVNLTSWRTPPRR